MKLSTGATASMEAIAFQTGGMLFKELTTILDAFIDGGKYTTEEFAKTGIKDVIFKRTGILIKPLIRPSMSINAGILPPDLNRNNVIGTIFDREMTDSADGIRTIRQARGAVKGTVDLANGMVGGAFSKLECKLAIYSALLTSRFFTAAEIAAVILHELGHVFSYYEFLADTVSTNQALASIAKAVLAEPDHSQRVIILASTEKELDIALADKNGLADSKNAQTIHTVLLTGKMEKVRSALGSGVYDNVSWEYLSDQFAARHGAGRDLVTGLDKMNRYYDNEAYVPTAARFMSSVYATLLLAGFTIVAPVVGCIVGILAFALTAPKFADDYDTLDIRFKRIRAQMVEALKAKDLDKYERDQLVDDIKVIDTIVRDMGNYRGFLEVFWDTVRPSRRLARKQQLLQQDLEKLAANALFVHSADLKSISESV